MVNNQFHVHHPPQDLHCTCVLVQRPIQFNPSQAGSPHWHATHRGGSPGWRRRTGANYPGCLSACGLNWYPSNCSIPGHHNGLYDYIDQGSNIYSSAQLLGHSMAPLLNSASPHLITTRTQYWIAHYIVECPSSPLIHPPTTGPNLLLGIYNTNVAHFGVLCIVWFGNLWPPQHIENTIWAVVDGRSYKTDDRILKPVNFIGESSLNSIPGHKLCASCVVVHHIFHCLIFTVLLELLLFAG